MRISLLIPAYNAAGTIGETLASICDQPLEWLRRIERIVVADDASRDDTVDIVRKFATHTPVELVVWPSQKNGGERKTVNTAFARLRDEGFSWCFVLHADDVAKPNWLEVLIPQLFAAADDVVSVCSSWDNWYPNRIEPGEDQPSMPPVVVTGGLDTACGTLGRGCWWHFSGCAIQLHQFKIVGDFCEDMPQLGDLEWLIRAALQNRSIVYMPRTLIKYRQSGSNVSSVSFRTNRDLRERTVICAKYQRTPGLEAAVKQFAHHQSKVALRRAVGSAIKLQFSRARSALFYGLELKKFG